MAGNEIVIKVKAEEDTGGFTETKERLHDVETASDKAGNAMTRMGRSSADLKSDLARLDTSIATSKAALGQLAHALANTDDAAQRIDIRKAMARIQSDLSASQKAHKIKLSEMLDLTPDPKIAIGFMSKLGGMLQTAGAPIATAAGNHVGLIIGGAAGAVAGPVLIQALGAALSGGIGAGVIGAGVMLAVKGDKNLEYAGKQASQKFMGALTKEAAVFRGPIRDSLGILEDAGDRVATKLGTAFDALSDDVVPFTRNITQAGERLVDMGVNVAKDSGPALDGLGDSLRLVTDGVGDMVETLASGGPEAADNLRLVAGAMADLLRYTGVTLDQLGKLANNPWITGPLIPLLRKHYKDAADASDDMAGSTSNVAEEMSNAERAARGEQNALAGLSDELTAQTDPVFGVLKAQRELRKAQEETAKATKEHGESSDAAQAALQKQAMAALSLESNVGKLGATFNGKMTPALRATLRAAGLTDKAIDGLEKQFGAAQKAGNSFAKTYKANAKVEGAAAARRALYGVRDAANDIPRAVTIAMRITGVTNVSKAAASIRKQYAHGGITGAANGSMGDGLTWTGEGGPELLDLPPGTRVHSAGDSKRMAEQQSSGGTPLADNMVLEARWVGGGSALEQFLSESIRLIVHRVGGGSVQNTFGS